MHVELWMLLALGLLAVVGVVSIVLAAMRLIRHFTEQPDAVLRVEAKAMLRYH